MIFLVFSECRGNIVAYAVFAVKASQPLPALAQRLGVAFQDRAGNAGGIERARDPSIHRFERLGAVSFGLR